MNKSFRKKKKEERETRDLVAELKKNKQTHAGNIKLLEFRIEAEKAAKKDMEFNRRKFELSKGILGIEIKHLDIIQPMMGFHKRSDWQEKFKEMKKLELVSIKRDWEIFLKNNNANLTQIKSRIDVTKVTEQQNRIEIRNPEIVSRLKELGIELEKPEKQDYIG